MNKSINEGGIAPLGGERDAWSFKMATMFAKKNKISMTTPIKKIPAEADEPAAVWQRGRGDHLR
jgi:excinuclease ABC subunit A